MSEGKDFRNGVNIEEAFDAVKIDWFPFCKVNRGSSSTYDEAGESENDLLSRVPANVGRSLMEDSYEPGEGSVAEDYLLGLLRKPDGSVQVYQLIAWLFMYATSHNKQGMAYNVTIVFSELPYSLLDISSPMLAVAMTRSAYLDVQEAAVRCFENWESKSAGEYLESCHFEEKWLQAYAEEVCEYLRNMEMNDVLPAKAYTWKMAEGERSEDVTDTGYSSRRYNDRFKDFKQRAVAVAG